jgi:hypothetical protein
VVDKDVVVASVDSAGGAKVYNSNARVYNTITKKNTFIATMVTIVVYMDIVVAVVDAADDDVRTELLMLLRTL